MERTTETIIQLIGNAVCGNAFSAPQDGFSDSFLVDMFIASNVHDVTHMVGSALMNNKLLGGKSTEGQYKNTVYTAVYRYEKFTYVLNQACTALEKAKIPYIPLKGSVIRDMYPQPWMRTSCDIDILVREQDLQAAARSLLNIPGYSLKGDGEHDVSIVSQENVCIELHFSLIEERRAEASAKVLENVWDYAMPAEHGKYRYVLDDAMFYFYHIAHMAKHFIYGGCGIRPFLDLWLMEKEHDYHSHKTAQLLKKGKLTDFDETARALCEVWFGEKEHDQITYLMQEFILSGGCFGTKETRMLSEQQKHGGRKKYIIKRIFVPYNDLKERYPRLKKYRFLLPFYEICRLWSLIFGKRKHFRKSYMNNLKNVPDEHIEDINTLFERVGL